MEDQRLNQIHVVRTQLHKEGPTHLRPFPGDFERVALPREDGDILRDALIAENAKVVIEVGLAYGSSALAIGEALLHKLFAQAAKQPKRNKGGVRPAG